MTKCFELKDLNQKDTKSDKKCIEFVKELLNGFEFYKAVGKPKGWDNVVLLSSDYEKFDLIWAYDNNNNNDGLLYLGHWNDGVVE